MEILSSWIDRSMQQICRWLNDFFPGNHGLAVAGGRLAGMTPALLLPVDRRRQRKDERFSYIHDNMVEKANAGSAKGGSGNPAECGFWAYCHISGQPCVWCGGKNSLTDAVSRDPKDLCPTGKPPGSAWFGCCKNPAGKLRMIAFADCCSDSTLVLQIPCKFRVPCSNWPGAKNWCTGRILGEVANWRSEGHPIIPVYETKHYYCTVVVDHGSC